MNLLLRMADRHIPVFIKKRELKKLFRLTSSAFAKKMPSLNGLSYDACLAEYARFTKTSVDQSIAQGVILQNLQDRLFQQAFEYGRLWRKRFAVANMHDVMQAGKILYRAIGIEFHGTDRGVIEICACFFSPYYTPAICKIVSSLDAGIMAGLSGGNLLTFSRRITEGFNSCKAQLIPKEFST